MCLGTHAYHILLLVIDMCQHIKDSEKSLIKKPEHMWLTQSFPNLFVLIIFLLKHSLTFPYIVLPRCHSLVVKNPSASAGDERVMGSIPGSGRSPLGGHGNPP